MAVLAMADQLTGYRGLPAMRTAQLADEVVRAPVVDVHLLACQRCAPAVGAALAVGLQRAQTAAQEHSLELLDMAD